MRIAVLVSFFLWMSAAIAANCGEGGPASINWQLTASDIAYQPGPNSMRLDIYHPMHRAKTTAYKTVILIHGGCFEWGGKKESDTLEYVQRLTNAGYAVVAVDYRLTKSVNHVNEWPASMIDVQDAVRWVRAHGSKYGLDTQKLVAMGYSAGATLAAYLGTRPTERVDGVIDFFGRTDFTHSYTKNYILSLGKNYPGEANKEAHQLDCGEIYTGHAHERNAEISKASVLSEDGFDHVDSSTPCTLIVHGTADTAVSIMHSELFHNQILQASKKSADERKRCYPYLSIEGAVHMLRDPKDESKHYPPHENLAWNSVCPFLSHILGEPPPKAPELEKLRRSQKKHLSNALFTDKIY